MRAWLVLALCAAACTEPLPPPGHVELFVETDVPLGDGGQTGDPLFDTVRIELYRGEELAPCAECARDFPLSTSITEPSITVTTRAGGQVVAHVCIFRARWGCIPDAAVETWAHLPSAPASGGTEATVSLLLSSVGVPSGSRETPVAARPGRPRRIARWKDADPVPCAEQAGPDEACIPGGAFWMGHPLVVDADEANRLRRLVVVDPFFLDKTEVSVASYRRAFGGEPPGVGHFSGRERGDKLHDYCTFTSNAGPNDELPVNCVTWSAARAYCEQQGRDLPTEAQFEFASAGQRGRLFVWGNDLPTCEDAVWGRQDPEHAAFAGYAANKCARPDSRGLPLSITRENVGRDVLPTPDGDVRDLAGNVGEWMRDGFQDARHECWSKGAVLYNPFCKQPGESPFGLVRSIRGGAWFLGVEVLAASHRVNDMAAGFAPATGFRCVRGAPAR